MGSSVEWGVVCRVYGIWRGSRGLGKIGVCKYEPKGECKYK